MYNFTFCNTTAEYERIEEDAFIGTHSFHDFGLWIAAGFGGLASIVSFVHMFLHATHYSKPYEQKHILRILFMIPIYAVVSFLSFKYYLHTIYFDVLRDCYEAFAIASFFNLVCSYMAPSLSEQKTAFRLIGQPGQPEIKNWLWPVNWLQKCCGGDRRGCVRKPRSGLTWFNIIYFCVFQYCFVRVAMTIVAVVTQSQGRYCLSSLSPAFAHIWVTCIEGLCVTFAMYGIIQFYYQVRHDIAEHKPFSKVLAIKLVIFLSFWQTIILNFLTSSHVIKSTNIIDDPDIIVGIPAMLICVEMAIFSVVHLWAYPWTVYSVNRSSILARDIKPGEKLDKSSYHGGFLGVMAFLDAANPWDIIKAIARGFRWIIFGMPKRLNDTSYDHVRGVEERIDDKGERHQSIRLAKRVDAYHPLRNADDTEHLTSQAAVVGSSMTLDDSEREDMVPRSAKPTARYGVHNTNAPELQELTNQSSSYTPYRPHNETSTSDISLGLHCNK